MGIFNRGKTEDVKKQGGVPMTRTELLAQIHGSVRDKAIEYSRHLQEVATRSVENATTEIDEIVKGYQVIVEAMPIDLLEVLEKGGRIDIRSLPIGDFRDNQMIDLQVVNGRGDCGRRLPMLTLAPGDWEVVLLARRVEK